ncbi:AfsR/SARP family transcriptional regulator [Deinococcus koreensis]|uniref:Bacterial transcriptional activator domain-containing protein n=1 Tax=Deinococcus koreensis TaxID=2054903 RepID=A0A2K3USN0_9DEIO|nr:BTAD domain-containing putative transcriptional regulator [Deinococcus koreensis]PNY79544.1 hypothetical protein CVO96_19150 [Deinococcus koreensis]
MSAWPTPTPSAPTFDLDELTQPPRCAAQLIGAPTWHQQGAVIPLARKAAALLAMLAFDGSATRVGTMALLWPETPEDTARNNLVQLRRKLRDLAGHEVVLGREVLSLSPLVPTDIVLDGPPLQVVPDGELLHGQRYDDCPDLELCVLEWRERLDTRRFWQLRSLSDWYERQGQLEAAVRHVTRWLRLDPCSEDAHGRLMRLYALSGNRHRAVQVYCALERTLRAHLDVAPLPATQRLLQSLLAGGDGLPA